MRAALSSHMAATSAEVETDGMDFFGQVAEPAGEVQEILAAVERRNGGRERQGLDELCAWLVSVEAVGGEFCAHMSPDDVGDWVHGEMTAVRCECLG